MAQVLDSLEPSNYTKSGLVRQELGNISTQSWVDNIPRFADYWNLTQRNKAPIADDDENNEKSES